MPDSPDARLEAAWLAARADGVLGNAPMQELIAHTAGYVSAVCSVLGVEAEDVTGLGVDVGSGAGLPGLLLALAFPGMRWRLVDASERRCDLARAGARAAGVEDRVSVHHGRAEDLGHEGSWRESHDLAVARLLGAPAETGELLVPLVRSGGLVVVSAQDEAVGVWRAAPPEVLGAELLGVDRRAEGSFLTLRRSGELARALPRRSSVRKRSPLF